MVHFRLLLPLAATVATAFQLKHDRRCRIKRSTSREEGGFAPWTHAFLICQFVTPVGIAVCDSACRNPQSGERLDQRLFRPKEVLYGIELQRRDGKRQEYYIPVACDCVVNTRRPEPTMSTYQRNLGLIRQAWNETENRLRAKLTSTQSTSLKHGHFFHFKNHILYLRNATRSIFVKQAPIRSP